MCYGCDPQFVLRVNVDSSDIIILHLEMSKVLCRDCLNLCLAEWVLLVRCHLPRAGLLLIHQPERLAAPAGSSCSFFSFFGFFLFQNHFLYWIHGGRFRPLWGRLCTCETDKVLCLARADYARVRQIRPFVYCQTYVLGLHSVRHLRGSTAGLERASKRELVRFPVWCGLFAIWTISQSK